MSDNDKKFLKEFSRNFHQKIIDINDFCIFEKHLIEWIKNIDKNTKTILELMQCSNNKNFFTSIIGFFYQYGICCDVDENKALEMYLLAINNEESLRIQFTNLNLLEENDDVFNILQNNNIIIGKYLLSLFYYKDIILENSLSDFVIKCLKSARKGD